MTWVLVWMFLQARDSQYLGSIRDKFYLSNIAMTYRYEMYCAIVPLAFIRADARNCGTPIRDTGDTRRTF